MPQTQIRKCAVLNIWALSDSQARPTPGQASLEGHANVVSMLHAASGRCQRVGGIVASSIKRDVK